MARMSQKDWKNFAETFSEERQLLIDIVSRLRDIRCSHSYGGDEFYLFPKIEIRGLRRAYLLVRRPLKQHAWSFSIIRDGKADVEAHRDSLDNQELLRMVRDVLQKEEP